MKIVRSSVCSLKFSNNGKRELLSEVLSEYGRVVNYFIDVFWDTPVKKNELLAPIVNLPDTWLTARLRKVSAREALDMVSAVRNRKGKVRSKPTHQGNRMNVSSTIASLERGGTSFDGWLHLSCIGHGILLNLPIKFHKHYNRLAASSIRLNSYIITQDSVQFCFERETGKKNTSTKCIGIDTGIKSLATTSDGIHLGTEIESLIERSKRCKHGSKGHKRANRTIRQRIDEVAKQVTSGVDLGVVENLTGISSGTKLKRRLSKNIRRSIGSWNFRHWMSRVQQNCEEKNVSFRTVHPRYTSQQCSGCGYTDRRNRLSQDKFLCLECNHTEHADINAAKNILNRFLSGPYGAGCKAEVFYA